jgi:hypothetical protein
MKGVPPSRELAMAVPLVLKDYIGIDLGYFNDHSDDDIRVRIRHLVETIKADASPGYPYLLEASTNAKLFDLHSYTIVELVVRRIRLLQNCDLSCLQSLAPSELVDKGFCDPVRVFVKQEPHNSEKVLQGRLRLISSVSVVDSLVERYFSFDLNKKEIANWTKIPSKPGIHFCDGTDVSSDVSRLVDPVEADVSGWDWSVSEQELMLESIMRSRLCSWQEGTPMWRLVRSRYMCLSRSVFVTSDGYLYEQTIYGAMKSGCYNTSSSNSRIRVLVDRALGSRCIAMGDDSVGEYIPDAVSKYESLGHVVKMYNRVSHSSFEFCSHQYDGEACYLKNWLKTLFRLLNNKYSPELLEQFKYELRGSPYLSRALEVIAESGWISVNYDGKTTTK